ncbi:phage terminase small subunit [Glutamicibacter arilaitensis]|uniref:phage terminase small subunit n=1 Tax=Glutamicibacter arilaitensis TaxID=256701 RepID=UPI003F92A128
MAGKIQKRSDEKVGHYKSVTGDARPGVMRKVKQVNADRKKWHPRAIAWFDSLKTSGQSDYFQDSDWAQAKIIADLLTHAYDMNFMRMAQMMDTISSMMAKLGTTEADRRQLLRIELEHEVEEQDGPGEHAEAAYLQLVTGGYEAALEAQQKGAA